MTRFHVSRMCGVRGGRTAAAPAFHVGIHFHSGGEGQERNLEARPRQNVDESGRKSGSLSHFHLLSRHLHDGQRDTNASELA